MEKKISKSQADRLVAVFAALREEVQDIQRELGRQCDWPQEGELTGAQLGQVAGTARALLRQHAANALDARLEPRAAIARPIAETFLAELRAAHAAVAALPAVQRELIALRRSVDIPTVEFVSAFPPGTPHEEMVRDLHQIFRSVGRKPEGTDFVRVSLDSPEESSEEASDHAPKRPGRPKGSKNKPKEA